jgi:hypothetical protein
LNDEGFCDLFYREYRAAHASFESMLVRYQLSIATIVLLSGIIGAITRTDLIPLLWTHTGVFVYYVFAGFAAASLIGASVCVILSIRPRGFRYLDDLQNWRSWRNTYRDQVVESGYGSGDESLVDDAVAKATCDQITARLAEATDWNVQQNRLKLRWINYSFYWSTVAIGWIALQATMHAILFLIEVNVP